MSVAFGFFYFKKSTTTPTDTGTDNNFFSQFNPFKSTKPNPATTATTPADVSGYVPPVDALAKLMRVSSMPIAGFTVFSKERLKDIPLATTNADATSTTKPVKAPETEFVPALRYVAKENGNIYQTFVDKINERKFSVTVIPKVYDAYFGNKGGSVIMRYLKNDGRTIETFLGTLPKELLSVESTGNNEIKGSFLPDNVRDISISPDTSKVLYLFNAGVNTSDRMVGTTLNCGDGKKVQVLDSPFTEWLSQWPSSNTINFSTKPSASVPGYMYTTDTTGKNLTKVLGGINGLTTLSSPDGKLVLYGDSTLALNIYHTDTKKTDSVAIKTLPEKCVWGKASDVLYCAVPKSINFSDYPDSWYQGETSFQDQIWKIDIKTQNTTLVIDPATVTSGEDVDATNLTLDTGENYLFFTNKKDSFLLKLNLK